MVSYNVEKIQSCDAKRHLVNDHNHKQASSLCFFMPHTELYLSTVLR